MRKSAFILFFWIAGALVAQPALSSILVQVTGKLTSITENEYLVETPNRVYYIRRKGLSPDQAQRIPRVGAEVTLNIPPEVIVLVRQRQASGAR